MNRIYLNLNKKETDRKVDILIEENEELKYEVNSFFRRVSVLISQIEGSNR